MENLLESSVELYKELSSKNFPRDKHEAYLTCFLNIGSIDKFLTALEENAAQQGVQLTAATPRKTGAKSKAVKAVKSRRN